MKNLFDKIRKKNIKDIKHLLRYKKYSYRPHLNGIELNNVWIHIVDNSPDSWILSKFVDELEKNLSNFGVKVTMGKSPEEKADINHHIIYTGVRDRLNKNSTVMVTHVDTERKIEMLKQQISEGVFGICMSNEVLEKLVLNGVPRHNLCFINPAHDCMISPKKYVIGITHRCYNEDFRKRDSMIVDVCRNISPEYFKLKIMGSGWEEIVPQIKELGFEIDYYPEFDKQKYNELMVSLDFFYYDGWDEGNMGYLDALAAGITSLVTPQGYHLDMGYGTIFCKTINDFSNTLNKFASERQRIHDSVMEYTWEMYAFKHLQIWLYMLRKITLKDLLSTTGFFMDGIHSVLLPSN